ncbi:cation-transporting P-type ATPase [Chitinophaga pollutisoli]|uniref:Cation-transporting P-type ATPase n=1 Tax=Chitinophaga pollutisoli TaxID=3133966 RepID=A0ABZ2YNP4_9BACT
MKVQNGPGLVAELPHPDGLRQADVERLQQQFGKNAIKTGNSRGLQLLWGIVSEPMFILLVVATSIYMIVGQFAEGGMMVAAILIITAISIFQEKRSERALKALETYTREGVKVIRDGKEQVINAEDLVPGDVVLLEEGNLVPADACMISGNDFTVNEAIITGESFPVSKHADSENNQLFQGTTVNSGMCYAKVEAIGSQTQLGKLGKAAETLTGPKTLLQRQVGKYVKRLAIFGISAFVIIWMINFARSGMILQSLLFALVLAMSAIPEEIPVTFSSFMALGAYQLSKWGIVSRNPQVIENLGMVDVVCLDKTGTITANQMTVELVYRYENEQFTLADSDESQEEVLLYAMFASERVPFDAMEKAIVEKARQANLSAQSDDMRQIAEYPLEGRPPMMTHIYEGSGRRIAAAKGAIERILSVCRVGEKQRAAISEIVREEAEKGYRMIGVASAACPDGPLPASQDNFNWNFEGVICLYDPPRISVRAIIDRLLQAGISIKLLTGDYAETARNISGRVGIPGSNKSITGKEIMEMPDDHLQRAVQEETIFARMFPEAKQRVVEALQKNGHVVAMIGDGVNDVPALKKSDIGIAMGQNGAEMARSSSDLVLTDDKLEALIKAIGQGRKIFLNLKKSIRYIITIHIPIILIVTIPLVLGWPVYNVFTPVHVIFLELIMGPTCSLFFEREPVEADVMEKPPRDRNAGIMSGKELWTGIMQGIMVTLGLLVLYYIRMQQGQSMEMIRTEVLITLLCSNIFLTFANRSFTASFRETIKYRNNLVPWVLLATVAFILTILLVPAVRDVFGLLPLSAGQLFVCAGIAFVSVGWYELYKLIRFGKQG